MNYLQLTTVAVFCFSVFLVSRSEQGECRYDETACSCKLGEDNQGICWDKLSTSSSPMTCSSRFCRQGWTCSCAGRTHLCPMRNTSVLTIERMLTSETAECSEEIGLRPSVGIELQLGTFGLGISRKGLLANACNQISWYYNGEKQGEYGNTPVIDSGNLEAEYARRSSHTLYEFKSGDLIAFRFKNASYYCFTHYAEFDVNGTIVDRSSSGDPIWFANAHSENWFTNDFVPTYGVREGDGPVTNFVPLRSTMLGSGRAIGKGEDLWQGDDGSADHQTSNWYFRIQL